MVFAAWILGWRILSFSSWYGKSNLPQAQRVAELLGVSWVLFGLLTGTAAWSSDETLLAKAVLKYGLRSCPARASRWPLLARSAHPGQPSREDHRPSEHAEIAACAAVFMMV